jgi:hypothetical protein
MCTPFDEPHEKNKNKIKPNDNLIIVKMIKNLCHRRILQYHFLQYYFDS